VKNALHFLGHFLIDLKSILLKLFVGTSLLAASLAASGQTATIIGYPANFDAYNNTGAPVYGFEIEADGIQPSDVTRVFGAPSAQSTGSACYIRYCIGSITPFAGGVYIRWTSPYDPNTQQFTLNTPLPNGTVASGESCWTLGLGARYNAAGCEHFGISTLRNPTNVTYRWLVPDSNNPGMLTYYSGNSGPTPGVPPSAPIAVPIPQPVINLIPGVNGAAPAVAFHIELPPPAPLPLPPPVPQFGDAQWVKVYKLELNQNVALDDLMGGNPAVPEAAGQVESSWNLMQYDPDTHSKRRALDNQGPLGGGSRAVVRRYEHYKYVGTYDPNTHQALCGGDGTCSAPQPGELGDLIGAQNAAANVDVPSVTVAVTGGGSVRGGPISCGNVCAATFNPGASLALTANPPSNGVFNGWSGACSGNQLTCGFTVNSSLNVGATFTQVYTLSVSRAGNGTVSGTPAGESSGVIDCGKNCTVKFQSGTKVTLTATPAAGAAFTGWTGACTGTANTCVVSINDNTKAQANFK
jgi:hypothetical protein